MAGKKSFAVLSRIRCSGTVYAPDTENDVIELGEKEAERLLSLRSIGAADDAEDGEDAATIEGDFDLKAEIKALGDLEGVKALNMADLGKLLSNGGRGVRRKQVNAVIAEIEKEAAV